MTPGLRRAAATWDRFWFETVDGLPLGVARVGIALAGLVQWAGTLPLVRYFYSDAGEFPIAAARGWSMEWVARLLMPDLLGSYPAAVALFALWGAALLALLLGWRTAVAAWATWLLTAWFFFRNPTFVNGGDEVLRLTTLYLALGYLAVPPRERALSLDRRRTLAREGGSGADSGTRIPAWPVRMIQIQICVVYLVSGFWKVVGPPWWDGSALHYALDNAAFTRFGSPDWPWLRFLYIPVTLSVAWWEFLFPLLVAGRRSRIPALLYGVTLHLGILLTMSIGIFPFVMLGCYPVFLRPEELRWLGRRARHLLGRPGQAPESSRARHSAAAGVSQ